MDSETLRLYQDCTSLPARSCLDLIDGLLRHLDRTRPREVDYIWQRVIAFRAGEWPDPAAVPYEEVERLRRELMAADGDDSGGTG